MSEAVIVAAVRTPIGKRNGSLSGMHAVDLSGMVLDALAQRVGLDPALVDDVIWGCVTQSGDQAGNVGRYAVLAAGWPDSVPGVTINRACGSSQQSIDFAAQGVMSGQYKIVVAGGVEIMSRVPLGSNRESGTPYGPRALERYDNVAFNQGVGAELIAEQWGFSRTQLDEFAVRSHELSARAQDDGSFTSQILAIDEPEASLDHDEGIRRGSSVEKLAALKPVFRSGGMIHAGNSSQVSDGAAALLITTPAMAKQHGWEPIARYCAGAVAGSDPVTMLTAPIPATKKLLQKTGLKIEDVGVFEVNEAFSSIPLAWLADTGADIDRVNPLGGAIAVGHPLGGSGAILMTRMIHHMRASGIRYGLQTMCEGGGTANATLVELAL